MKEKIEKKLFKSNYLILTPKIHSFGGFFESFLFGLKIKNFYNKKLILAIPLIDVFRHFKINERKFDYDLILKVFFKLSLKEKVYSIFFSIWLNLNLILIKFKLRTLIKIIFKINNIDNIIFYRIGFSDDVNNNYNGYNLDNYNLVYQADISKYLNNMSYSEVQKSQTNPKKICFCVKDANYQKIKAISLDAVANIENYRDSLVYLLKNEYSISRVGDSMMSEFPFKHKNYTDTTGLKNYYKELKDTMLKSNIYFGTSGSHTYVAELYNLKKIISNSIDFQYLCASFNFNNWTIFKKIFDLKQKKLLSLYEIYELYNLIETDRKRFKSNKGYNWEPENLEKRSNKNYYFFKKIFKFVKINKSDQILDYGSGYGPLLHILKKKNFNACGLEPSRINSRISKKLGHNVINGYLDNKTFKNKKFKIIVSLYALTYVNDLANQFEIFRKILKDNGYILLRVHQYKLSKSYWMVNHFKNVQKKSEVAFNYFSNNSLKNLFNFHNFDIVLFEKNIEGVTVIAKKTKKKNYKIIGNYKFEIFYIRYLVFLISNIFLFLHKIKIKMRKLFLNNH